MTDDLLTYDRFAALLGEQFVIDGAAATIDAELVEATLVPNAPDSLPRAPFSLLFRGPAQPLLEQATYTVSADAFGSEQIFIVPVRATAEGVDYEAIFN